MSSFKFPHYNKVLKDSWSHAREDNVHLIYQPSSLQIPYDPESGWPLKLPEIKNLDEDTVIVIHFQDSLTFVDDVCLEIKKIEQYYPEQWHKQIVVVVEDMGLVKSYKGMLNVIWFPTFVYETMYQMKKIHCQWTHYIDSEPTKKWISVNGIPKWFRQKVVDYLQDNFDTSDGILSLGKILPLEQHAYYDTYYGTDNPENFLMLEWVFTAAVLNIVCETVYDTSHGIVTEKTLFAFLAGQVPLIIAHQGYISQLENMGFDMFSDIIDTSYDNLPDNIRWHRALEMNHNVIQQGIPKHTVKSRLEYNKNHALNVWPEYLIDTYCKQMQKFDFKSTDLRNYLDQDTSAPS